MALLTTDVGHNSAFDAIYNGLQYPSILLNGRGNLTRFSKTHAPLEIPEPYNITFDKQTGGRPKRYLLRLINTSFDTTFVFSIDNHNLTVIGADFVPIYPYSNTSVLVGIGQRYNVVVEAKPIVNASQPIPPDGNFWMRTFVSNCANTTSYPRGYELSGIVRYNASSRATPNSTKWNNMSLACSDETYGSLRPVLEWSVGSPSNLHGGGEHDVILNQNRTETDKFYPLARFALDPSDLSKFVPLRVDYDDPTFLHLNNTGKWPQQWVIVPEDYADNDWVCSNTRLIMQGVHEETFSLTMFRRCFSSWLEIGKMPTR
jgi:hypothetical protein